MDRSEKQSARSERQIGPVIGSIMFLLAANLVAKGALGLSAYQTPTYPNNIQGSLFLTLNKPQTHQPQQTPLHLIHPVLLSYSSLSSTTQKPVIQQQIVNIRDPFYDEGIERTDSISERKSQPEFNHIDRNDDFIVSASENVPVLAKPSVRKTKACNRDVESTTEFIDQDVDIQNGNFTEEDEIAKQLLPNITFSTATTTRRPASTTSSTESSFIIITNQTAVTSRIFNTTAGTNATVGYGYGPYSGKENVSITYSPPISNTTGNASAPGLHGNTTTGNATGPAQEAFPPYYYGNYGPSNGNENISIAYGPPVYQKPFFSSPEDTFLNQLQNYNNFYEPQQPYYNHYADLYKQHEAINRFYNKYEYQYPSFYNNYLGK